MRNLFILIAFFSCLLATAQDGPNLFARGNEEMNKRNYRKAEEYYLAALAKEPQNWNIMTNLGFCYHKQLRYKDADSIYKIVIANDSGSSKPYWYKGMNHVHLKQDSMVVVCYKKFLDIEKKRNGNLILGYRNVGDAYARMLSKDGLLSWQIDDMIYHYEQLEQIDPSIPDIPDIQNYIDKVKAKRPANQLGKWKLVL